MFAPRNLLKIGVVGTNPNLRMNKTKAFNQFPESLGHDDSAPRKEFIPGLTTGAVQGTENLPLKLQLLTRGKLSASSAPRFAAEHTAFRDTIGFRRRRATPTCSPRNAQSPPTNATTREAYSAAAAAVETATRCALGVGGVDVGTTAMEDIGAAARAATENSRAGAINSGRRGHTRGDARHHAGEDSERLFSCSSEEESVGAVLPEV